MAYSTPHPQRTLAGMSDEQLERLAGRVITRSLVLSISTRGVGTTVCHLGNISTSDNNIPTPDIYRMYRLFLGLLEVKLQRDRYNHGRYPLPTVSTSDTYQYVVNADMDMIAQTAWVPEPIGSLLNAVGVLQVNDITYFPAVPSQETDVFVTIPHPESLLLSNLRTTVEFLSDPATPERYREDFHEYNPIPGTKWKDGHVLANPDDIIPADYFANLADNFRNDLRGIESYLYNFGRYFPRFALQRIDFGSPGSMSLLVSNVMGPLKAPDIVDEDLTSYCRKCKPQGEIKSYYARHIIPDLKHIVDGMANLLGEIPRGKTIPDPVSMTRHESLGCCILVGNYSGATSIKYAF